jgi:hypothetical protein
VRFARPTNAALETISDLKALYPLQSMLPNRWILLSRKILKQLADTSVRYLHPQLGK